MVFNATYIGQVVSLVYLLDKIFIDYIPSHYVQRASKLVRGGKI